MQTYFCMLTKHHIGLRSTALGWPLAVSQEEQLSYGIGSPFYAGRLEDFIESNVFRQFSLCSQLPASWGIASWDEFEVDSESLRVEVSQHSIYASSCASPPGFGLASCRKPGRAPVLRRRLTLGAWRLGDFIEWSVFRWICFCTSYRRVGKSLPEMRHLTNRCLN